VSALDASKTLPDPKRNRGKSSIVVDAIDEMNGLERLVVFGVGLDEEISGNATLSREVRSRIYRAITRAHSVCHSINKRVEGGWFEPIEGLELSEFDLEEERKKFHPDAARNTINSMQDEDEAPNDWPKDIFEMFRLYYYE
jgi:hypothetical protein